MKITYRIPTEMYGFVEISADTEVSTSFDDIRNDYDRAVEAFKPKPVNELPTKEWNACLDKYLLGQGMSEECMHTLSPKQSWMIHEIDKCLKRIKSKEK